MMKPEITQPSITTNFPFTLHPSPLLVATEFVLIKREVDCAKHLA